MNEIVLQRSIILNAAREKAEQIAKQPKFRTAPWRRKVKILAKEHRRFLSVYEIPSFRDMYGIIRKVPLTAQEREKIELLKEDLIDVFGIVLNISFYRGWDFESILRSGITNKEGAYLTRMCRKRLMYFHARDLRAAREINFLTRKPRNIKRTQVPFYYRGNGRHSSLSFWKGFDYAEWLQEKN